MLLVYIIKDDTIMTRNESFSVASIAVNALMIGIKAMFKTRNIKGNILL